MIEKFIRNLESHLKIYVGLLEVTLELNDFSSNEFLALSNYIENNYNHVVLQIFNEKYIVNTDHILSACYFAHKAFLSKINISKSKNIELLLYLSTNRQIKNAIYDFGLDYNNGLKQNYLICIISPQNNLEMIYLDLKKKITLNEIKLEIESKSIEKFYRIKNYFNITDNQLKVILKSYNLYKEKKNLLDFTLDDLFLALSDIIREKMLLLSLEKITLNSLL